MVLGGRPPGRVGRRRISQSGTPPPAEVAEMATGRPGRFVASGSGVREPDRYAPPMPPPPRGEEDDDGARPPRRPGSSGRSPHSGPQRRPSRPPGQGQGGRASGSSGSRSPRSGDQGS